MPIEYALALGLAVAALLVIAGGIRTLINAASDITDQDDERRTDE